MEATSKGWSERRNVIGYVLKFGFTHPASANPVRPQA